MAWTPSATAIAVEADFRAKLADVSITAAETYMPKAMTDAIAPYIGNVNGHSLGTTIAWSAGAGAGQYSFGAAAPNATIVSIVGCDEGGTISLTTNAATNSGDLFTLHFGSAFPHAPAGVVFAADAATSHVMFIFETWITMTASSLTLNIGSPLANAVYSWHWIAKGRT